MSSGKRRLRRALARLGAQNQPTRRIAIATPMMDMCHTAFTTSLVAMVAHSMMRMHGVELMFLQFGTSILPQSRILLGVNACEKGATDILWIDSDMEFPPDLLERLLRHKLPIVAANCIARRPPYAFTARREDGTHIETNEQSTGLEKVGKLGFGVVLHSIELLKALPMPWFEFTWIPEKFVFAGEDFTFCEKAKAAGFDLYIDHDVSKDVKHIGTFPYSPLFKAAANRAQEEIAK